MKPTVFPSRPTCATCAAYIADLERTIRAYQLQAKRRALATRACLDCDRDLDVLAHERQLRCDECQQTHAKLIHRVHARDSARRLRLARRAALTARPDVPRAYLATEAARQAHERRT